MENRKYLEQALQNPNVRQYLGVLAEAEGTAKYKDPYKTGFGGAQIDDLSRHPGTRSQFRQTDGKTNVTTAAGKYQFIQPTWDNVSKSLGLNDFSPFNQDLAALELMRRNGSLEAVMNGNFDAAIKRDGKTWASLPSSPYAQPKRSMDFIQAALGKSPQNSPVFQDAPKQNQPNLGAPDMGALSMYGVPADEPQPQQQDDQPQPTQQRITPQSAQFDGTPYAQSFDTWLDSYLKGIVKNA